MAIDLTYLKKRAEMIGRRDDSFADDKVQAALLKIVPPALSLADVFEPENNGFECAAPGKHIRNWVDLIPEKDRGFVRFIYADGREAQIEKYIRLAMTSPAWKNFQSLVSAGPGDSDLFLMRWLIWHHAVLRRPVGADFGNYEMNLIFNSLPVDVSRQKVKIKPRPSFADFYRQIKFAEWGLRNAN